MLRLLRIASCVLIVGCTSGRGSADEPAGPARVASGAQAAEPQPSAAQATVVLSPPGHDPVSVNVELARTPDERRLGLMHRQHLDAAAGMLFLFDAPAPLSFWMRNTYIPLDMIFIQQDLAVLGVVENAEPLTDTSRNVPGLSQYVLEVNGGFARAHGIAAGTMVRFEGVEGF